MLAATPSIYKPGVLKAFKLGGHSAVNGASTDGGAGIKYVNDMGLLSQVTLFQKEVKQLRVSSLSKIKISGILKSLTQSLHIMYL